MNIDKTHLRHVILFKFIEGINVSVTTESICKVYGKNAVTAKTVRKWFAKFKRGDFNLEDKPRSGRPIKVDDDLITNIIASNSRISTDEIAHKLNIAYGSVFGHLKKLGYILKHDVWVPHVLTERNKLDRVSIANSLLGRLTKDLFLDRLVTGDEKLIVYNVQRKQTLEQSNKLDQSVIKADLYPKKAMLSVWWDCNGVIFYELFSSDQTISSDKYCEQLDKLKVAIQKKRTDLADRKNIVFHYDNTKSYATMQTIHKLRQLNWDILLHPPYSPDIAPSDYYLFQSLQNDLNEEKFESFEDLKNHISTFFDSKPTTFYDEGIRMLPERWQRIINNEGEYLVDE